MNRKIMILFCLVPVLLMSCTLDNMRGGAKAEMIVIGMDYQNAAASPLSGTINDAMEMGAAMKTIMAKKGVPFELKMLVQEGYDMHLEVQITSGETLQLVMDDVERRVRDTKPSFIETKKTSSIDGIVTARVKDEKTARYLKQSIEEVYDAGTNNVHVRYASMRKCPGYPSRDNVLKELENVNLGKEDLLVIYYTGHGQYYDVAPGDKLETRLQKHVDSGEISSAQKQQILEESPIYSDESLQQTMRNMGLSETVRQSISTDIVEIIAGDGYRVGSLITAPTEDEPLYGHLDMEQVYSILRGMECKVVFITDACYSGYTVGESYPGSNIGDAFASFMQNRDYPNIVSMSASTKDETSKVTIVPNEERDEQNRPIYQRHSMFTIELLKRMGWAHTDKKFTYITMPAYSLDEDGNLKSIGEAYEVHGYLKRTPPRQTAESMFDDIMSKWQSNGQTPQRNGAVYEIYLIP